MRPSVLLQKNNPSPAVVITGGSSGIGLAFIKAIYKINPFTPIFNLSRKKPFIKSKNAEVFNFQHIETDLSHSNAIQAAVKTILRNLNASALSGVNTALSNVQGLPDKKRPLLLINNSGFGSYGNFSKLDLSHEINMLQVNNQAILQLSHLLIPYMIENGGAIMNIASISGFQPTPFLATYGATKAFLLHWSLALAEELKSQGIQVLTVCPGPTSTQFYKRAGLSKPLQLRWIGQQAEQVVYESIKALNRGKTLVVTGWQNKWLTRISSVLPKLLGTLLAGLLLKRIRMNG